MDVTGSPLVEDVYGNPRIVGGAVDIGAVEGVTAGRPAESYLVTSLDNVIANDGVLTFIEAFEAANRNELVGDAPAGSFSEQDVIRFADGLSGTVLVDNGELAISGDLRIDGPGAEHLTFDARGQNRVFWLATNVSVSLSGMTITGGSARDGGGIYSRGDTLTITGATLSDNSAGYGGGIYSISSTLTVTNSTLSGNSASTDGGGICSNSGTLTVTNSTFSGNTAGDDGGGVFSYQDQGTLTVANSTLSDNSATHEGGGIFSVSGTLTTVTNSTLSGNSASWGGGIYHSSGELTGTSGTLTVTNSTLSGNSANVSYGGIRFYGNATLNNTIVAGNAAPTGWDIYCSGGTLTGSHNLIGDGSGQTALVNGVDGNLVGTASSPIDPALSDWTQFDNGHWGYYLLPGSPAVDAGDNALALDPAGQPLTEDILGNARIAGGTVDIGAVEGATPGRSAENYLVTSLDNVIATDGVLTFLEAFEAANCNQPVGDAPAGSFSEQDVIQFADGLSGTVLVDNGQLAILGDLRIEGPGAEHLTFDARGENRVFSLATNVSVSLSGMTITGGSAPYGGGIYGCDGTLTIMNSTLAGNSADHDGGGIYSRSGTLIITNSTLLGNSATSDYGRGGGIYSAYGTLAVTNSTLAGNSAAGLLGYGGGIYSSSSTLTVTNSTLSGNAADYRGGGIYSESGTLTVTDSAISGNAAEYGGGVSSYSILNVTNSTLSGNSADFEGGGIVAGNATLNNTIVAGNVAPTGPDVYHNSGGTLSGSHNLIGNGTGQYSLLNGVNGNLVGTSASPIDPGLSQLTRLDSGLWGYYLLPGSVAIDAGDNAIAVDATGSPLVEDIDGNPRIVGGVVDIGAIEGATATRPAESYLVTSLDNVIANDGVLTFIEAFEAANRNQPVGDALAGSFSEQDVIRFADGLSGTVLVDNGELAIFGDLRVEGPGAEHLTFDARGQNRVFWLAPKISVSLDGMTITGGSAVMGGGIYSRGGTVTITDSTLSDNSASGGGGIYIIAGTLTLTNSTLSGNSADSGGGILNNSSTLTVSNSTLSGNSSGDHGGGIYIYHYSGTATMSVMNSTLSGNSAARWGGGIYFDNYSDSGTLTVMNSTLSGNSARDGGGIYVHGSSIRTGLRVTNSTLSGNSASGSGGGIYFSDASYSATLNNTIVAGNQALSGPDIHRMTGSHSGFHSSHNLIGDGTGQSSLVNGVNGNLVGTASLPIDPRLSDLTQFANGQWGHRLLPGSPAINAGSNALAVDASGKPLATDLEGKDRILYGTVDIGALEYRMIGDANLDGAVNALDATILTSHWRQSGGWADGDFNGDGRVDDRDASIMAAHWSETVETKASAADVELLVDEVIADMTPDVTPAVATAATFIGPRQASALSARRRIEPCRSAAATETLAQAPAHDAVLAEGVSDTEWLEYRLAWSSEQQTQPRERRLLTPAVASRLALE